MGCGESTPEPTMHDQYNAAKLPQPFSADYENEFEKQLFMAINLCRYDPKSFISTVKQTADTHPLCKDKNTKDLIAYLQKCEQLTAVTYDD